MASVEADADAQPEKKRRDRGKKSKKENEAEAALVAEPGNDNDQPLTELPDTNTKKVKAGRRNRGKKDNSVADIMDVDPEVAEDTKDYHS